MTDGPDAPRSEISDLNGEGFFPALSPVHSAEPHYDIDVVKTGYVVARETKPPLAAARIPVTAGNPLETVIKIYQPATITVNLKTLSNATFTAASNVYVSSSRGSQVFPVPANAGTVTITSIAGEPVVPTLLYSVGAVSTSGTLHHAIGQQAIVPANYPTTTSSTFNLTMRPAATVRNVRVEVRRSGNPVNGATVLVSAGPLQTFFFVTTPSNEDVTFSVPSGSTPPYTFKVLAGATWVRHRSMPRSTPDRARWLSQSRYRHR